MILESQFSRDLHIAIESARRVGSFAQVRRIAEKSFAHRNSAASDPFN